MDDFLWFKDGGRFCGCENKIGMKGAELFFCGGTVELYRCFSHGKSLLGVVFFLIVVVESAPSSTLFNDTLLDDVLREIISPQHDDLECRKFPPISFSCLRFYKDISPYQDVNQIPGITYLAWGWPMRVFNVFYGKTVNRTIPTSSSTCAASKCEFCPRFVPSRTTSRG